MDDELKADIERWFYKHIADGPYSEALYELMQVVDVVCLSYETALADANAERTAAIAEYEELDATVSDLKRGLEGLLCSVEGAEDSLGGIRTFIKENIGEE